MPAKELSDLIRAIVPGKWGRVIAAGSALALASVVPIYETLKPIPVEGSPIGLPFKEDTIVMIAKGLDPHGAGCTSARVSLSDPKSYGFETNDLTITKRTSFGFEAKFGSDRTNGRWSAVGRATPQEITAAFMLEGDGQGIVKLRKKPNQPLALGYQTAHDCVGNVELACPVAVAAAELKGSLRDDPNVSKHLSQNCILLPMPQEKTVRP